MKLYNTLTRKLEEFTPLDEQTVRLYSCGPTVYDNVHIGNLASFTYADLLRRTLQANDYSVIHVMNFTDVDDKTIKRSKETYPKSSPIDALRLLTTACTDSFLRDMSLTGNSVSDITFVSAVESIESMRQLIIDLFKDGFAYITDDGVYFSIQKYRDSGKKYGQLTEITSSNTSNARINNDEYDKDNIHDFVLWKIKKPGEPSWPFTIDGQELDGRPGWHIECSAMSVAKLGRPFDLHTGGIDLKFPHHENEIAQSTAGGGDVYAKSFIHNEHVLVDGKKMAKSAGNFYTLRDIEDKGYDAIAFRIVILQSHYRSQSHFSWQTLEAATNKLHNLRAMAALKWQPVLTSSLVAPQLLTTYGACVDALNSDMNSPRALTAIDALETVLSENGIHPDDVNSFDLFLTQIDNLLGLNLSDVLDISAEVKKLLKERTHARDMKEWQKSDELREKLLSHNVTVRDTKHGQVWAWKS